MRSISKMRQLLHSRPFAKIQTLRIFHYPGRAVKKVWGTLQREQLLYPCLALVFLILNILFISHRVNFEDMGERLQSVKKQILLVKNQNKKLEREVAKLSALPRIQTYASDTLNMVVSNHKNVIVVNTGETCEEMKNKKHIENVTDTIKNYLEKALMPKDDFMQRL